MARGKMQGEYDVAVVGAGGASMGAARAREWAEAGQRAPTRCTNSE
jgi:succinate dehydrogenase/fumarate reductase flavoprotein subunit